jgi:hypothetical protein
VQDSPCGPLYKTELYIDPVLMDFLYRQAEANNETLSRWFNMAIRDMMESMAESEQS